MLRRRLNVIAAAAVVALVAAVTAMAATATDPGITSNSIKIGGTFPLSGPASLYATIPQAEKAYFDWFNARSSINGRKIDFKFVDDGYDPSQTVPLTRQLVEQDQVFAIFNSLGTAPDLSVRDYLNERQVPQVLLATGDSYWGTQYKKYKWTIGFQPDYPGEGIIYGQFIKQKVPQAKIGVLMQNDPYGQNYLAGLKKGLGSAASKIVDVEPFDVTAPDVTQQMVKLKASGANVLMDFATPTPSIKALITAAKISWSPTIFVNSVSASASFMKLVAANAGAAAVNRAISTTYLKDPTDPAQAKDPGVKLFRSIMARYYPKGDIGDALNVYGMAAAWTMIYALQHSGKTPTRAGLMKALTSLNTKGNPFLLKGISLKTTKSDWFPLEQQTLIRWQGDRWHSFGHMFQNAR